MSQIIKLLASDLVSLTGDTGGAITATVAGTININGVGSVSVDGTPAANLLEISLAGSIPEQFDTDVGSAIPALGILDILGGTNLNSSGADSTVTLNLDDEITLTTVNATNIVTTNLTASALGRGIVQSSAAGILSSSEGTDGQVLVSSGAGAPAFANISSTDGSLTVTNGANTINIEGTDATTIQDGVVELATDAESIAGADSTRAIVPTSLKAKLGLQTAHGLLVGAGTAAAITSLGIGTTNQVLLGNTGADPTWGAVDLTTDITGILPIANGGTNANAMTTAYGVNYFDGTRLVTTAAMADGQLLIGNAGNQPTLATLTGEHGVEITNAAGSIKVGNLLTINNQVGTAYTTVIEDQNKMITMTNADASTLTIPPEADVAYDIGCAIYVQQLGAGQVTLTPGAGVTFKSADDAYKLAVQNSGAALIKTDNDQWSVFGDVTA